MSIICINIQTLKSTIELTRNATKTVNVVQKKMLKKKHSVRQRSKHETQRAS